MKQRSYFLKIAIFATGVSGLVSEFILSTLASYFIGDTIVQWTIVLSIMLFTMGLGSQLSRYISKNILRTFLLIEFCLSLLISIAPLFVYSVAGYTQYIHIVVYGLSALIGLCIGFEIPLVTRLNEEFENIRTNVSSVMTWDYVGGLIGGLAFAFWGLPVLGLKNTAFLFGLLNLLAAIILLLVYWQEQKKSKLIITGTALTVVCLLVFGFVKSDQIMLYGEQKRYKDKIVYVKESKYQKLVITTWLDNYWLYINGNLQLSTIDEFLYHEPMIHPIMQISQEHRDILIIGGGDGFNVKELLKYDQVQNITLVDIDPEMTSLGMIYEPFVQGNDSSLHSNKVTVLNEDGFVYLQNTTNFYDVIIVDLPDAKGVDLNKLYTKEFYDLANLHLKPNGHIITQAGSPYYATRAFECINKTMKHSGFETLKLHNQVLSMGEWGWILGSKRFGRNQMIKLLHDPDFPKVDTRWLNLESVDMMLAFGKPLTDTSKIQINTINDPVLYRYQLNSNWDIY
ncbi:MAG: spermidine synthase [Bacteroidetes bacterium]|nr:polyamine aminopropyltransferase [Bacteroidia bacterium]PCH69695.1 MAG: spermidine synthase [Bacteroidota bacterium]